MPLILPVKGILPSFGNDCYIAPNATIVGDVVMGADWFDGGKGDDLLYGGGAADAIFGGTCNYLLVGDFANAVGANDTL